ncbi:MAG: hypothetical protein ACOZBW_12835 [Thermodesulfobacteriota bacterium]
MDQADAGSTRDISVGTSGAKGFTASPTDEFVFDFFTNYDKKKKLKIQPSLFHTPTATKEG